MAIAWSEDYATGEPEVDKQHKMLFQYLNDLEEHMAKGVSEEFLKNFLDALGIYTRSHFCYEEICMRRRKCPSAKQNKEQHDKLLAAYVQFCERFEAQGVSADLVEKLHAFLVSWLKNHIMKTDMQLKACN